MVCEKMQSVNLLGKTLQKHYLQLQTQQQALQ